MQAWGVGLGPWPRGEVGAGLEAGCPRGGVAQLAETRQEKGRGRREEGALLHAPRSRLTSSARCAAGPRQESAFCSVLRRRIKRREGNPWGWHGVCGPGVIYSPRQPGADCLGGPFQAGPPVVWGKAQKAGQASRPSCLTGHSIKAPGPCPRPSVGS